MPKKMTAREWQARNLAAAKQRMAIETPEYLAKRSEWTIAYRAYKDAEALMRKLEQEMYALEPSRPAVDPLANLDKVRL